MSLEVIAMVTGSAVIVSMAAKLVLEAVTASWWARRGRADFLEISVHGRDYSVDLAEIGQKAPREIEAAVTAIRETQHAQ
jgi:hypothetical protein